ncbi:MAG TPA: DUF4430 domain-containing protein [Xanthobacteraceae bacterium]|nr:DUF4430 domain-containing protein [Xanthobacteraceae bacterium]
MNIAPRLRALSRRFALVWVGFVLLLAVAPVHDVHAQSAAQSVRLVVDYGDGVVKIFDRLPWSKGITVLDVLNAAKASAHGITFSYTGLGPSALLTDIDGLQNQGGGSSAKNWQYWVNTTYAQKSFAVFDVQAEDTVFWRFTTEHGG